MDIDDADATKRQFDRSVGGGVDRDKLANSDFVIPGERVFPVVTPGDVRDAVASWGRYRGGVTFETFKRNLIRLCRRKGPEFVAQLPQEWRDDMEKAIDLEGLDETKAGRRLAGVKLEAAKDALAKLAELVKWAAYEDGAEPEDEDMAEEAKAIELVTASTAVKALGDGKVGGHLILFGDPEQTDLSAYRDYFTSDTDYDLDDDGLGKSTVLYHHGQDATLGKRKLGRAVLRMDEVGVWIEAQLKLRDDYERAIYDLAAAGKMGWSSGTAPHLVEREPQPNGSHHITRWPLGLDASLTPIPAEPRIRTMPLKSYLDEAAPYVKALTPETVADEAPVADATETQPEPEIEAEHNIAAHDADDNTTENPEMDNEQIQAMIAEASEKAAAAAADAAVKAYEAKLAAEPAINPAGVANNTVPAEVKSKPDSFKSFGEQLQAIIIASRTGGHVDRRLLEIKAPSGMSETVSSDGGFLVQTDFAADLFRRVYDTGLLASRVRRIPISANANGLRMNAINETSRATGSRWGGITGYWMAEAGTKQASAPKLRQMDLNLHKLAGLCYATDELLADAAALETVIRDGFAEEFAWLLDDAILNGTGAGQPLGILQAGCLVSVGKETGQAATTFVYENAVKMWARLWSRSKPNAVWLINQDVEPQLYSMSLAVGTGGVPVYMPAGGVSGAPYGTLFGRPVLEVEQSATLGTQGDVVLADLSQYVMIEKGGMDTASSIHVKFTTDETTFRFVMRVDGQPAWNAALTPASGSGNTLSPFVALDTRS